MTAKIIEQGSIEGAYGFESEWMVVDHPKYGRLLLSDGYGGDDLNGYCYRWRHGVVCKLRDDDTMERLLGPRNDGVSILGAATNGYDESRPVLEWTGYMIDACARSAK